MLLPVLGAPTTILLVDDTPSHLRLGTLLLSDAGFKVQSADSAATALASARLNRPDAILSDVVPGEMDGFGLCRQVRMDERLCEIPVVLTSVLFQGTADGELAARVGANALVRTSPDFSLEIAALLSGIVLGAPARMPVIDASLDEAHARRVSQQMAELLGRATRSEERYRELVEQVVTEAGPASGPIIGAPAAFDDAAAAEQSAAGRVAIRAADGAISWVALARDAVELRGGLAPKTLGRDATGQLAAIQAGEARYRRLVERLPTVAWSADASGEISSATANVAKLSGFTVEEVRAGGLELWFSRVHPEDRLRVLDEYLAVFESPAIDRALEFRWRHKNDDWLWLRAKCSAVAQRGGAVGVEGLVDDFTASKGLEERLRQAQRMEAVGHLTAGLAHDFNNLLTVILANAHFLGADVAPGDARMTSIDEIQAAGLRAAALTRQLLTFIRKQALHAQVFAPSEVLTHFCKMLRRLIGEDIELTLELDRDVSLLEMDQGQLEQVVMNLVVNARDAMPSGGRLGIRLSDVVLSAAQNGGAPQLHPGTYVMLAVSDTGAGVAPDVQKRMFEPFFTTKADGRGTGLGLATVHSIVKDALGAICVETEIDRGTTFKVYLPRVAVVAADPDGAEPIVASLTGTETVLLVEDDATVATVCRRMLEAAGYRVLMANGATAAVAVLQTEGPIDLVIADMVMPASSGPKTFAALSAVRPDLKVLYISGYLEHPVLGGNRSAPEQLLTKPFTSAKLLTRVRRVLGPRSGARHERP